ncbi:septum site-determining protein MinC [Megalodesulfovibrio gigas]|uniref:septum site-determining protein MinC n=1 Tax=Megalodesulfovibrio gigas TaxID=879 RepID=UPI0003F95D2C|nr:septum site-determining protein MinC [Megalodesulfovibrio gigas]
MTDSPQPVLIKGRVHPMAMLLLRSADAPVIAQHLAGMRNEADGPDLLARSLICLDCSWLGDRKDELDLPQLVQALRQAGLAPVAVKAPSPAQEAQLPSLGCIIFEEQARALQSSKPERVLPMVVDRPVRCGQTIYAKGRDLIVLAGVNPGAEVLADGNIHVYGALRGRALAGALGDVEARVHCGQFLPELVGVAGVYLTSDELVGRTSSGPALCLLEGEELTILAAPHGMADPGMCGKL